MKIKSLIALVLFFSLLTLNVWAAGPPQVLSSIPADGDLTADPWTLCLEVTFSEPMVNGTSLRYSTTIWDDNLTEWSADKKILRFCRKNINSPLPLVPRNI